MSGSRLPSLRRLRVGISGIGAAGQAFIAPLAKHAGFEWSAVAEPDAALRERMQIDHGVAGFATLDELLARADVDAVYVASPTPLHARQVCQAAAAGRHVLVEKPMAIGIEDAQAMVDAAQRADVVLLVGHSHSYDAPIAALRSLIASGELGAVRQVNTWCYTDWVRRPRRADELDAGQGGGVTFRQGAHQFDIVRLLCGGRARSVRAKVFDWDPARRVIGAHTAFIDFEDGPAATVVYNGYGGFSSMDLCFDVSEWGFHQPRGQRPAAVRAASPEQELIAKQARAKTAIPAAAPHQPFFGLTLVSCERGDIRQSRDGLMVYRDGQQQEIAVGSEHSPRDLVLAEWHAAITGGQAPLHDGRWGLANVELCAAAIESSRLGRELALQHQIGV